MPDCICGGLRIIGDVHGDDLALRLIHNNHTNAIQIGDLGLGFGRDGGLGIALENEGLRFFRGNHDEPARCGAHPRHLHSGWHPHEKMFVLGGELSIDKDHRIPGRSWWAGEQHSMRELRDFVEEFADIKPRLVLSHGAPESVTDAMFTPRVKFASRTAQALQAMLEAHQPDLWLFGHWHRNRELQVGKTLFCCVGEKQTRDVHLPACPMFADAATPSIQKIAERLNARFASGGTVKGSNGRLVGE